MIDNNDLEIITNRMKDIFMLRSECDTQMMQIWEKQSTADARLAVIESQLQTVTRLQWTILVAVVTAIVGAIMGLILK